MEEIYVNVEYDKSVDSRSSANQTGPRSSGSRFYRAAVLCLGLLSVFLLIGLISLGVHYHKSERGAAAELSTDKANMTELLQDSEKELSSLTAERNQLKTGLSSLTAERNQLKTRLIEMTKDRDRLENLTRKTCPAGWTQFSWSCYLLSDRSDSWTNGRIDCQNETADLVVINCAEEQNFISEFTNLAAWIGLSDGDDREEGIWKWIDGTTMTLKYWSENQPDNGGNPGINEDCGHIKADTAQWNDLPCTNSLRWICEKKMC